MNSDQVVHTIARDVALMQAVDGLGTICASERYTIRRKSTRLGTRLAGRRMA